MNYDQKEAKRRAEIMLAFAEGAKVEVREITEADNKWRPTNSPAWDWYRGDYRIKKEPRMFYINAYPDGSYSQAQPDRDTADQLAGYRRTECIKVVEVFEDAT